MFEQDQSQSQSPELSRVSEAPEAPEKKVSTVVLLAAGGVLVATVCATLASMFAAGAKPEAGPPNPKAEVEADQPATTSTSLSVAPDGSTATVVITVPGKPKSNGDRQRNAAGAADGEPSAPEVAVTPSEVESSEQQTTRPKPPPSSPQVTPSSTPPVTSSSTAPPETSATLPTSGDPTKP